MPGKAPDSSFRFLESVLARRSGLTTEIEMGTSTSRSERFWAVTTISLSSESSLAVTSCAGVLDCAYAAAVITAPVDRADIKRNSRLALRRGRARRYLLFEITF